ncbi:MAG: Hsp20/alpha crystallin family protein [Saprospiraceae bacterium]|nr:Hsp20/alpha crystallin family protein [Saprospiraceae bacterium]
MHYAHEGRSAYAGCQGRRMGGHYGHGRFGQPNATGVPVNIRETDEQYELLVLAPARNKSDFQISVENRVLIIAYQEPTRNEEPKDYWVRNEFRRRSFERRFELNEGIDSDNITAQYNDGVLVVTLPKLPGFVAPKQEISVA